MFLHFQVSRQTKDVFFLFLFEHDSFLVYCRSIDTIESGSETDMGKNTLDKSYSKYLTYLKRHDNEYKMTNNQDEGKQLPKRDFFLFPSRRSSQRYRPVYSYGRKSHWDTFFG